MFWLRAKNTYFAWKNSKKFRLSQNILFYLRNFQLFALRAKHPILRMFGRADSGAAVPLPQLNLWQLRQNLKNQKIFAALRAGAATGCDARVVLKWAVAAIFRCRRRQIISSGVWYFWAECVWVTLSLSLRYSESGRAFTARGSRAIAGNFVFTWPL